MKTNGHLLSLDQVKDRLMLNINITHMQKINLRFAKV